MSEYIEIVFSTAAALLLSHTSLPAHFDDARVASRKPKSAFSSLGSTSKSMVA